MSGNDNVEFTFVCPECGECLGVDGPMKDALTDRGCVVCGAPAPADAFTRSPSAEVC